MKPENFKMAISAAHTPASPGAKRGKISEYSISSEIVGLTTRYLSELGHLVYSIGTGSNIKQVRAINKGSFDFGFELHFNSHASTKLHGSLVMHSGSSKGKMLAKRINKEMVLALGTSDKGTPIGHYELDVRKEIITMIKKTKCPFVIVEPLFLSNEDDFSKLDSEKIANAIVTGVLYYWANVNN